jgi:hypothetical protein
MEKSRLIKAALKKQIAVMILLGWAAGLPPAAEPAGNNKNQKVDYVAVNQEILKFEAVLNGVINNAFSSSPYTVIQKAKGAYLEDFGLSFSFCINIHRALINTPLGQFRSQVTPELKKRQIEKLKEQLIGALQENGEIFQHVRKDNYIAIIAYFEDRNIFPDEPSANKTIVLRALKKDLDELSHRTNSLQQFKQRIKIIEY